MGQTEKHESSGHWLTQARRHKQIKQPMIFICLSCLQLTAVLKLFSQRCAHNGTFLFLWCSSAALEEALIVHDSWIHWRSKTERRQMSEKEEVNGKTKSQGKRKSINRDADLFFTISCCKALSSISLWIFGTLRSGPFSLSLPQKLTLPFLTHTSSFVPFPFPPASTIQSLSFSLLLLSTSTSPFLISYLTMSPRPRRVTSSLTLSFPVVSLIYNSTSSSFVPLCPPSLSAIISPAPQQITLTPSNTDEPLLSVNWPINNASFAFIARVALRWERKYEFVLGPKGKYHRVPGRIQFSTDNKIFLFIWHEDVNVMIFHSHVAKYQT